MKSEGGGASPGKGEEENPCDRTNEEWGGRKQEQTLFNDLRRRIKEGKK